MITFRARDVRFRLDHRAGLLIQGDRRIDLPRQQYELLQYLLQNRPGELITREELLDHVWKGRSVNEEALTRALHRLRGVLGDNDREGVGFIETVRGRGVRFAGVIETDTRSNLQARKEATSAPSDVNHDFAGRGARLEPAARTSGHIPVFYVESLSRWPYEGIQSKAEYEIGTPIDLETNLESGTKYRCFPGGPSQAIDWGLLGHNVNGGVRADINGNDVISSSIQLPPVLWIQIEYKLFQSAARADDELIGDFRNRLMMSGGNSVPLWGKSQSARIAVGSLNDPHFQWYEMGEPPTGEATYAFASSVSSLRYINEHTIPAGVDYQLVLASVIDLRTYTKPPRYSDLLANFERLEEWFLGNGGRPGRRG